MGYTSHPTHLLTHSHPPCSNKITRSLFIDPKMKTYLAQWTPAQNPLFSTHRTLHQNQNTHPFTDPHRIHPSFTLALITLSPPLATLKYFTSEDTLPVVDFANIHINFVIVQNTIVPEATMDGIDLNSPFVPPSVTEILKGEVDLNESSSLKRKKEFKERGLRGPYKRRWNKTTKGIRALYNQPLEILEKRKSKEDVQADDEGSTVAKKSSFKTEVNISYTSSFNEDLASKVMQNLTHIM